MDAGVIIEDQKLEKRLFKDRPSVASLFSVQYFSLLGCLGLFIALVFSYFLLTRPLITLPADILMWEESNFVGDIIKLRIGAPMYTSPADSNSFIYTPLAPLLTYAISWLISLPNSIVAWRLIQLGYVVCAVLIAAMCTRTLRDLADPEHKIEHSKTWLAFTFLTLFLVATSPQVNRFVSSLHVDALALLVSMISFWTMLRYLKAPSRLGVVLMAVCPALGYLTKQFLISWAVVMFVFLLLHNHRDLKRIALFCVVAAMCFSFAIGGCYLLWGDPYIFWTFKVMGARKQIGLLPGVRTISVMRMLDNVLTVWPEIAIGIIGCILVLRHRQQNIRRLGPLAVAWFVLVLSEVFSSGAGWETTYHLGPAVLIGAAWLLAVLPLYWPRKEDAANGMEFRRLVYWTRTALAMAGVMTLMIALRVVPTGDPDSARYWRKSRLSPDLNRYLADIESEFKEIPPDKVLLDIGNWVYLPQSVLQKDRAVPLGDQPPSGHYENMDVFVSHIQQHTYKKILVHDLHSPFFIYDWQNWPRSSGVRQALAENYQEVRTIAPPEGRDLLPASVYAGPVSVLIPR